MSVTRRVKEFWGEAGTTVTETSTAAVQDIDTGVSAIKFKNDDGVLISSLFITCATNPLNYSFTADPVSGGLGHVLQKDGDGLWLHGADNIRAFRFISSGAQSHAFLTITPFYGDE